MSISKKYCQPCGASPNIYDDGHINFCYLRNSRDCIQPWLWLIPARVRGGISTSRLPAFVSNQSRIVPAGYYVLSSHPYWLSARSTCEGPHRTGTTSSPSTLHHHPRSVTLDPPSWAEDLKSDQTCSEEAGLQTETNPAEDETTAQRKSALLPPCIVIYLVKYIY